MRTIRILKTGTGSDGRPWVRGVTDFEGAEGMNAARIAQSIDASIPEAAFGLVNGLPDDAAAKLRSGDCIAAEEVNVTVRKGKPYEDDNGVTHVNVDCTIRIAGKCTRTEAPTAECDW